MLGETQQHTPDEKLLDGEQVVVTEPTDYPVGNATGIAQPPLEPALAWQVGQGYGNQVGEYDVQSMTVEPMTEITTEWDYSPHEDLSYAVNPMTTETVAAMPVPESNVAPAEDVFVINFDRLGSMSVVERQVYLRNMVVAMYEGEERMRTKWEEDKREHENDPELVADIKKSDELRAIIDDNRKDMEAQVPPEESLSPEVKKSLWFSKISDALYRAGTEFVPQLVLSAALIAGAAGTATEAHGDQLNGLSAAEANAAEGSPSNVAARERARNKEYGNIGAKHTRARAEILFAYKGQREKMIAKYNAKRDRSRLVYVGDKQALLDRKAAPEQINSLELATTAKFDILELQRQDALKAIAREYKLAVEHDMQAELLEKKDVERTVNEQ